MFTIDTVVSQSAKSAKQISALVKDASIRKELDLLIDAQAEYTKTVYNSILDLTKVAVENFGKVEGLDISKYFTQVKSK